MLAICLLKGSLRLPHGIPAQIQHVRQLPQNLLCWASVTVRESNRGQSRGQNRGQTGL